MGATQVIVTKTTVSRTRTKAGNKNGSKSSGKRGNPNKCPTCGRFR